MAGGRVRLHAARGRGAGVPADLAGCRRPQRDRLLRVPAEAGRAGAGGAGGRADGPHARRDAIPDLLGDDEPPHIHRRPRASVILPARDGGRRRGRPCRRGRRRGEAPSLGRMRPGRRVSHGAGLGGGHRPGRRVRHGFRPVYPALPALMAHARPFRPGEHPAAGAPLHRALQHLGLGPSRPDDEARRHEGLRG